VFDKQNHCKYGLRPVLPLLLLLTGLIALSTQKHGRSSRRIRSKLVSV
jgi:hypothetical protein